MISRERGSRSRGFGNPDGVTDTPRVLYQGFLVTADIIPALCALRFCPLFFAWVEKFPAWGRISNPTKVSAQSNREGNGATSGETVSDGVTLGFRSRLSVVSAAWGHAGRSPGERSFGIPSETVSVRRRARGPWNPRKRATLDTTPHVSSPPQGRIADRGSRITHSDLEGQSVGRCLSLSVCALHSGLKHLHSTE